MVKMQNQNNHTLLIDEMFDGIVGIYTEQGDFLMSVLESKSEVIKSYEYYGYRVVG